MMCTADDEDYEKIRCDRSRDNCNMCCVHHVCAHGWRDKNVWRGCEFFMRGNCSFTEA